jgi:hypothetical protein
MSIREVRNLGKQVQDFDELNDRMSNFNKKMISVTTFGRVKVSFKAIGAGGKEMWAAVSRNELVNFALNKAKKIKDPAEAKELLETFKKRMGKLDGKVDEVLGEATGKRVKIGRKLASFSRHFFDRDKKIDKAITKLNDKISELHAL